MKVEIIKPTNLKEYDKSIDLVVKHIFKIANTKELNAIQVDNINKLSYALLNLVESAETIISENSKVGKFTDLNKPKIDIPEVLSKRIEVKVGT